MEQIARTAAIGAATIVGAKYLDANLDLHHDLKLIVNGIKNQILAKKIQAKDRCNFFYALEDTVEAVPNNIALVYNGKEWTYVELKLMVQRAANYFLSIGIKSKDHVALDFTNKPDFLFLMMGLLCIGAVPAPINYNLTSKPLFHCIRASDAKLFIFDSEIASNVRIINDDLAAAGIRTLCLVDPSPSKPIDISWCESIPSSAIARSSPERPPDSLRNGVCLTDMAMLIYTSGTTGLPKPAIVTFHKLGNAAIQFYKWAGITPKDRFFTCMPLYHATALLLGFNMMIRAKGTLVLGHKFSAQTFWDEVRDSKATCIGYVGEMCRYLLSAPPTEKDRVHNVRLAFGNGMRPEVWNRFRHRFGIDTIAELYAATEGIAAQMNCSSGDYGAGYIGRMGLLAQLFTRKAAVIVKIDPFADNLERGPDGLCIRVKSGEPGEMLFLAEQGTNSDPLKRFVGYYCNTSATESKIARDVLVKGDCYFRTGDIMKWEYDGLRRYTLFEDRIGDTFRWKGENVSTMEVAAVVGAYPGIDDANVYGVRLPNHDGRAGCVAISLHSTEPFDFKGLARHMSNILPRYAVPLFIRLTDKMILTGNMKHQKNVMREEGVDPLRCGGDQILWLKDGNYVPFTKLDWENMKAGRAKL